MNTRSARPEAASGRAPGSPSRPRRWPALPCAAAALLLGAAGAILGICGPFTDVTDAAFCPFILEIFTLGITTGTTPTTYDPSGNVTRIQMAAFLSRTVDTTLKRASRRAAMNRFWTPKNEFVLTLTTVGSFPRNVQFDGADLWIPGQTGTLSRVRASDARLLETWTGVGAGTGVLAAMKRVFVTDFNGSLYRIDPGQPVGAATMVASNLGLQAGGIAFDGGRIWTTDFGGSVAIITPGATIPWTVTTVTAGLGSSPFGALFDGNNIWVTANNGNVLQRLDSSGAVLQTVTVGGTPYFPVFDGTNLWVPNSSSGSVSVVRASNGTILRTLTGNGLNDPAGAAFDGERILVTNQGLDSVSLWKAADLTPLGAFPTGTGTQPYGACGDGTRFWIALSGTGRLARF